MRELSFEVRCFTRNTAGRDFIVGDIHGCFSFLQESLDRIGFDPLTDRLFSVGDLVDRGPESHLALEWLRLPWFHAVRGNHEEAAIAWADHEIDEGHYRGAFSGGWNIQSDPLGWTERAEVFRALPVGIELETAGGRVGILHADCPVPDWDLLKERLARGGHEAQLVGGCCTWSRDRADRLDDRPVAGVRAVVVGHTPFHRMTSLGNVLYIDTFAWKGGRYTILDAESLRPAERRPAIMLDWSGVV